MGCCYVSLQIIDTITVLHYQPLPMTTENIYFAYSDGDNISFPVLWGGRPWITGGAYQSIIYEHLLDRCCFPAPLLFPPNNIEKTHGLLQCLSLKLANSPRFHLKCPLLEMRGINHCACLAQTCPLCHISLNFLQHGWGSGGSRWHFSAWELLLVNLTYPFLMSSQPGYSVISPPGPSDAIYC